MNLDRPITQKRVLIVSLILFLILIIVIGLSLSLGTADVPLGRVIKILLGFGQEEDTARLIVLKIRLPRILLAGLVGFSLSLGGVIFQAILRNPLADPFILGVSSGSAFGAIMGIVFGLGFSLGIPLMAFGGAILTIYLVMAIASRKMGMESSTILLTGVIINAFFSAIIMFFISIAVDSRLHTMLFWLYGDLSQSRFQYLIIVFPVVIIVTLILYRFSRALNLITAGEDTARYLGVEVEKTKIICLLLVSITIGLIVSFSGLIGFVGLMIPHLCRMLFGSDHRLLIPTASFGGAIFLIAADTLARVIISPSELPVGVITAFMGAPFFIYLLKTRGSRWSRT